MKQKNIFKFLTLITFFITTSSLAQDDFETWPLSFDTKDSGITVTQETTLFDQGKSSAKVQVNTGSQSSTDWRKNITLSSGVTYTISFRIYHTEGNLKARVYAGTYRNYSQEETTGAWQTLSYDFTPSSTKAYDIGLRFYDQADFDGSEDVYVDDFKVSVLWTGSTNNDWSTTSNWNGGTLPGSTDNIFIPSGLTNYPTSAAAVTVNSVTINSGATLKAEDAFTGSVTYNRSLATTNWYLMSSPVSGETIQDIIANHTLATSGVNYGLAPYDNSETLATNRWDYQVAASSGTLTNGKGYSVKLDATGDISFTGTINATDVSIALTQGAGGGGTDFNLLGNPYTTFINSGTFLTEEGVATTDITSATLWLWNQATSTYVTKVAGDSFKIAPGQGFFVEANSTNNVTFTEAMQSHEATDTFQRSSKTEVHLFVNDGNDSKFLKVYYINGTTKGFDNGYDGEMFRGVSHPFALYSRLVSDSQGKNYQIQSLPDSGYESMVIPVGVKAAAGKEITFSIDALNLPADIKVFLEDRLTNTFTRLDETNSEYKVTLTETLNDVGRFYIHTTESVLSTEDVILNSVRIYKTDASTLKITGLPQGKTSFYLYNILGKEMMTTLFTSNGNKEISLSKLASGIYLAKMQTEKGAISKKIILE